MIRAFESKVSLSTDYGQAGKDGHTIFYESNVPYWIVVQHVTREGRSLKLEFRDEDFVKLVDELAHFSEKIDANIIAREEMLEKGEGDEV